MCEAWLFYSLLSNVHFDNVLQRGSLSPVAKDLRKNEEKICILLLSCVTSFTLKPDAPSATWFLSPAKHAEGPTKHQSQQEAVNPKGFLLFLLEGYKQRAK